MPISPLLAQCSPAQGVIQSYLHWVVETTHAPQLFHLGSIIPALCYEATRRGLTIGSTRDPFRMLTCLIAGPGSAKSTAKKRAKEFIEEWYTLTLSNGHTPRPYLSLRGSLPGVLDQLVEMKLQTGPAVGVTPVIFDLDEIDSILSERNVESVISELYDGRDYKRNLVRLQQAGAKDTVRQPRIQAVFCATQSSLENAVTSNQIAGGLFSRILFIKQRPTEADLKSEETIWPAGRDWALKNWATWKHHLDVLFDTQLVSRQLVFTEEARELLEERLWPTVKRNIAGETKAAASMARVYQHARVIAGCFALSETFLNQETIRPDRDGELRIVILPDHADRAVFFVETVAGERATGELVATLGVDPIQRLSAKIEAALRDRPLTKRDLYYLVGRPSKVNLEPALQTLLDADRVKINTEPTNGRARIMYELVSEINSSSVRGN